MGKQQLVITVPDDLMAQITAQAEAELRSPESQALWLLMNAAKSGGRLPREARMLRAQPVLRELQELYLQAGKPAFRQVAVITRRQGFREVSHSSVHNLITGSTPPTWPILEAVVLALGGDAGYFKQLWASAS